VQVGVLKGADSFAACSRGLGVRNAIVADLWIGGSRLLHDDTPCHIIDGA